MLATTTGSEVWASGLWACAGPATSSPATSAATDRATNARTRVERQPWAAPTSENESVWRDQRPAGEMVRGEHA